MRESATIILAHFFAFSFFAKMRKNFWILCEKSEENEEIAKENFTYKNTQKFVVLNSITLGPKRLMLKLATGSALVSAGSIIKYNFK